MKKILFALLTVLCLGNVAHADSYTINRDKLPAQAREMLDMHFPKAKIGMIKVDRHLLKKTDYDVKLVNGTKIEFNNAGKWTSVDCRKRQVPDALIKKPILNYVKKNGNGAFIVKIKNKASGYEVELSDGVELKFNKLGKLTHVEIDDCD